MTDLKLEVELVPEPLWYVNLRSELSQDNWDKLRRRTYRKAGYRCEICGGKGPKWPVECHEIWEYDDDLCVQKLAGLIALCPACHEVKHIGRAQAMGNGERAIKHFARVNGITKQEAEDYISEAFIRWRHRSKKDWQPPDLSWLDDELAEALADD